MKTIRIPIRMRVALTVEMVLTFDSIRMLMSMLDGDEDCWSRGCSAKVGVE